MSAPEGNSELQDRGSDAASTPETEGTTSVARPEAADLDEGRATRDRGRERRIQRQRRMKQAWRKLVDSFDEVFYNSDDDDDSIEPDVYHRVRRYSRSPTRRYIDINRGYDLPYRPPPRGGPLPPPGDYYEDRVIPIHSRASSRSRPLQADGGLLPADPSDAEPAPVVNPISYITQLFDYSDASRRGEYEEAYLRNSFENDKPANIFHTRGTDLPAIKGLVFQLISMYAIPAAKKNRRRRNRYDDDLEDDLGDDYVRHNTKSLGVVAELGTYMIIHSQAALKALRSIIPQHPDLLRLAETITVSEPFCFIVLYKKEIDEYIAKLPELPEPEPEPEPAPVAEKSTATGDDVSDTKEKEKEQEDEAAPAATPTPVARPELSEEQQQRHDLQILMNYIFSNDFGRKYEAEMALHAKQQKCTYENAWMLFRPGSYVYSWEGDSLNCFIVDSFELEGLFAKKTRSNNAEVRPRNRIRGQDFNFSRVPESIAIKMCYLEFDGDYIGRRPKKVIISPFEGEKSINTLPVFPMEYCDIPDVRENLIARGKKYVELTKRTYAEYDGETVSIPQRSVKSRIMIDSRTFYNDRDSGMTKAPKLKVPKEEGAVSSESSVSSVSDDSATPYRARRNMRSHKRRIRDLKRRPNRNTILSEHDILEPDSNDVFTDMAYMLCTQKIYGFILKERTWDLLNVTSIKTPNFQDNMIDDLVLKDEAKTLVQALSNAHAVAAGTDPYIQARSGGGSGGAGDGTNAPTKWSADFVQNKGEGRIFLLHGKPGVGKTTTAECVAEQSRSPLLSITCGDLGIYPDEVERNLMKWLKLATLWKAVLLLDEADVYLESRISGDLQRNSLVSIFLRALEYYQGLLFLTTNRIGTFDEALISRIHVVLHYPDFTDTQRRQIWETSFRKLDEERPDVKLGPGVMDYALDHEDLRKLRWNGREIRNAFNTIVALAEFDAEKRRRSGGKKVVVRLERDHLRQVVEMSAKFKEYMRRTKGMDESKFQHVARVRDGDGLGIVEDHRDPRRGHRG